MKNKIVSLLTLFGLICSIFYIYQQSSGKNKEKSEIKRIQLPIDEKVMLPNKEISIKNYYSFLAVNEKKSFSQNKEDGVIEAIFESLKIPDLGKYFVEFSPADGNKNFY
jgi:hypothetical protein